MLALQQRLTEVYEQNRSAVVRVKAAFREEREDEKTHVTLKVGSGFFISADGYVLVNSSRAYGADRIWVEVEGRPYAVKALGHDRMTNISLLQTLEPPENVNYIPVVSGTGLPTLGSLVISISCPLDFEPSPGFGVVTGIENKLGPQVFPTEYIRTTVPVDMGQGGCPILDLNGRLLGITVASIPEIDSSYTIPVEALIRVRDDLMFSGEMRHSWMGFEIAERIGSDGGLAVYLSQIVADSPAARAGLAVDDILTGINDRSIEVAADVPHAVFFTRAGQYATVRVVRDGEPLEFSVKTLPRPEGDPLLVPTPTPESQTVAPSATAGAVEPAAE